MRRPLSNWGKWIASLNSVDGPGRNSVHRFVLSARLGLWPALLLSSFAFGYLLQYPEGRTIFLAIDLCLAASIAFLFNDVRDASIDQANHIHRWSIKSRFDALLFVGALSFSLLLIAATALVLTRVAVTGVSCAMLLGLAYSIVFKRILLVGNLVAALLSISPGLIMLIDREGSISTDSYPKTAGIFLACAFLFLLSREIKFDEFDIVGDRIGRRRTLPMFVGRSSLNVVHAISVTTSLGSLFVVIVICGRFSVLVNCVLALITATVGSFLLGRAYFSETKERFYKNTRLVLLIIPLSMLFGF